MTAEVLDFLLKLGPLYGSELLNLAAIPPDGGIVSRAFAPTDTASISGFVAHHIGARNLYFGQNSLKREPEHGKAAEADVGHMLMLSADFDPRSPQTQAEDVVTASAKLAAFPLKPSFVVDTGRGLQAFWILREPVLVNDNIIPELKRYTASLAKRHFGADSTFNLDRLMRLPGTTNFLNKKKRAEGYSVAATKLLEWNDARYALADFDFLLADATPVVAQKAMQNVDRSRSLLQNVRRCVLAQLSDDEIHRLYDSHDAHARDQSDPARAVSRAIAKVRSSMPAAPEGNEPVVRVVADIARLPLEWLVAGLIPRGKVGMIAGDPGLGKSTVTLDLVAAVTTGARTPWKECLSGHALLLSAEDDMADTVRPRLEAAGANLTKVHVLEAVRESAKDGTTRTRHFNLAHDIEQVSVVLAAHPEITLMVIDPISAYLGGVDSHRNTDVRDVLAPLSVLAGKHRCTILCVSHLNKGGAGTANALYRVTGSLAFVAAARFVLAVVKDENDGERRLLLPVKHNLAPTAKGWAYRVTDSSGTARLTWEPNPVAIDADEVLGNSTARRERNAEVEEWLEAALRDGRRPAAQLWSESEVRGFSRNKVLAAKLPLKVKTFKLPNGWYWELGILRNTGTDGTLGTLGKDSNSSKNSKDSKSSKGSDESRTFSPEEQL